MKYKKGDGKGIRKVQETRGVEGESMQVHMSGSGEIFNYQTRKWGKYKKFELNS
jgi:hypothetical protein